MTTTFKITAAPDPPSQTWELVAYGWAASACVVMVLWAYGVRRFEGHRPYTPADLLTSTCLGLVLGPVLAVPLAAYLFLDVWRNGR